MTQSVRAAAGNQVGAMMPVGATVPPANQPVAARPNGVPALTPEARAKLIGQPVKDGLGLVIPVLGAHPQAGASGVALALADAAAAAGLRVLLIDCADPARSGLAGVAAVEGRSVRVAENKAAIRLATRTLPLGMVVTRRLISTGSPLSITAVPAPDAWAAADRVDCDLTIVDVGWDAWSLTAPGTYIGPLAWCTSAGGAVSPVLVARATAPSAVLAESLATRYALGMRLLGLVRLCGLFVLGEEWPQQALAVMGLNLRQIAGQAMFIPPTPEASVAGWDIAPAPAASVRVAAAYLRSIGGPIGEAVGPPQTARRGWRRG